MVNWNTVAKGRRTRRSTARSMNCCAKVDISATSTKRVGDHCDFNSTKFGDTVVGQSTFDKSESLPIKKRRHFLQSVSADTCTPPFHHLEHEYNEVGDLSGIGIDLLADAASVDDHVKSSSKEEPVIGDSMMLKKSGVSSSTTEFDPDSGDQDRKPSGVFISKVNRLHWDLNTLMDAWDEPCDDSITGKPMKDVKNEGHIEDTKRDSSDHLMSELSTLAGDLPEPLKGSCSKVARGSSDEDTEEEVADEGKQVLSCNNYNETSDQVMKMDTVLDRSFLINQCWSSDRVMSQEKPDTTLSGTSPVKQDESSSIKPGASERTSSDLSLAVTENVIARGVPTHEISGTAIDVPSKDIEDSGRTCGWHGANIQVNQSILNSDSRIQDVEFVPSNGTGDFEGHVFPAESITDHGNTNGPGGGSSRITSEDSCFGSNAAAQLAEPNFSAGKIGSQYNLAAAGYGSTKCQDQYDSRHEDGELRGSFLCSWEDNELADECVDYESDGRNGDGYNAADYPGSVTVDGAYGARMSPFVEGGLSGNNESESVEPSSRMHFVNDNTEVAGKSSNGGSGTTVDQPMVVKYQRDGMTNTRRLADRENVAHIDEYVSKTATTDENEVLFRQQSSPRRYGSPIHGERDGVNHWASWDSRSRHTSDYHGSRGRGYTRPGGITGDTNEISGLDIHHRRQNAKYMSESWHRGLDRKSSEQSDDFFGLQRRMALTRSVSNYRTRLRHSADFVEGFDPSHDEADVPTRLSRRLSRFSPNSCRGVHIPLPHQRSQSRSPRPWYSPGEQIFSARRHTRSPNFRYEEGMERMRVPFSSDFGQRCISPSSGHIPSPEASCRWVDDHPFTTNHLRRRRSPAREFKRTQQFDAGDEHFRPVSGPRNYSFKNKGGRTWRLESNCDDTNGSGFTRRGLQSGASRDVQDK